jgi:flagellar hook-associated protein 2
MSVQSMGIGSGIDVQLIIDQLVDSEKDSKQNTLDTKTLQNQSKISALGEMKSQLDKLKAAAEKISTAHNIISFKNNTETLQGMTLSTTSQARAGTYELNVSQMALAHKVALNQVEKSTVFQEGTLDFDIDGQTHSISWDDGVDIRAIRYLINDQSSTTGIQATVVSADHGESLILSSTQVGSTSQFSISATGSGEQFMEYQKQSQELSSSLNQGDIVFSVDGSDYTFTVDENNNSSHSIVQNLQNFFDSQGLDIKAVEDKSLSQGFILTSDTDFSLQDSLNILFADNNSPSMQISIGSAMDMGQDLKMTIDDLEITSTSNTVSNALEGVTFDITQATGLDQTLSISADLNQVSANVVEFVDTLNQTSRLIDGYVTNTESSKGAFATDSSIKGLITKFRNIMSSTMSNNSIVTGFQLGIEFDRYTKEYTVNEGTLKEAVNNNFDDLISFFGDSSEGIGTKFYDYLDDTLDRSGLLANMGSSLNNSLSQLLDDQLKLDKHISEYRERLVKQYSVMDAAVAQFQATGNFLTQWADSMNNSNKK